VSDRFVANVLPALRAVQRAGASSLAEIAEALNERGVRAATGGVWHRSSVHNLLAKEPDAKSAAESPLDVLVGGTGNDRIWGGLGADTFQQVATSTTG
jgi:hypothetical protein